MIENQEVTVAIGKHQTARGTLISTDAIGRTCVMVRPGEVVCGQKLEPYRHYQDQASPEDA